MVKQVLPFLEGEQKIDHDDVIIIADVDEIPRPATLTALRNCEIPDSLNLRSRMYYYSFQWLSRLPEEWPHPQAMLWKGAETKAAEELRMGWPNQPNMFNAAWHCSYCFSSLGEMVNKVTSFSHTEFNKPEFRDPEKILKRVRSGLDFFDRDDSHFDRIENNPDVPSFLQKNSEKYAFALDRDPLNGNFRDSDK
jgi:beta-1,4-mannosyl-glycoprotein beta-1,4-N-acetylglucosaminyltransferase